MTGYVHTINRRRGLAAIATDDGFTIVELHGSVSISLGDQFQWDDQAKLGATAYSNVTKGTTINVNVQAHGVAEPEVRAWLRL